MGLKALQSVGGGDFWLCKAAEGKTFQLGVAALVPKSFYEFYVDCFTHQENTVDLGVVILHGSDDAEVTALVLEKYFIGSDCGQP